MIHIKQKRKLKTKDRHTVIDRNKTQSSFSKTNVFYIIE